MALDLRPETRMQSMPAIRTESNSSIRTRPSILLISDHPVGETAGPGLRIEQTLAALRTIGDVKCVFLRYEGWNFEWEDSNVTTLNARYENRWLGLYRWLTSRHPFKSRYANEVELRQRMSTLLHDKPDFIWVYRARPYSLIRGRIDNIPTIVDVDDLNDVLIMLLLKDDRIASGQTALERWLRIVLKKRDSRRWTIHQHNIASEVNRVLVTSNEDKSHYAVSNVDVIPNGYRSTGRTRKNVNQTCQMLMVGGYHYAPNAMAARFLAQEVLPIVQQKHETAELVLVGNVGPLVDPIRGIRGVKLVGKVKSVIEYYAEATVAMTVLRSGAGSRLKVVEAMAMKVPLISTRFGAQGFDLLHGESVLFAESAEDIAASVLCLYERKDYADALAEQAYQKYLNSYEASVVQEKIVALVIRELGNVSDAK